MFRPMECVLIFCFVLLSFIPNIIVYHHARDLSNNRLSGLPGGFFDSLESLVSMCV
jgi:hypothetical protein